VHHRLHRCLCPLIPLCLVCLLLLVYSSSAVFFFRYLLWFGLSRRKENGRLFVVSLSGLFAELVS
jgi:hypothetical protein